MKWLKALKTLAFGLALAYAVPLACGSGGVVGGECKDGYVNCDGQCVDPLSDDRNCASCGNECDDGLACKNGECVVDDGTEPEGGAANSGGSSSRPGGSGSNEAGNGAAAAAPQGGAGGTPDIDLPVGGQPPVLPPIECLPPYDSAANCGACGNECVQPEPLCAPDSEGGFHCVPKCVAPLVECQGQCVDPDSFNSDPDNCGRCGNKCPSDICQVGKCVGARYGNIALLCMDFNSAMLDSAPTTLLGNAVFAAAKNPVRVLAYTRGASPAAVTRVHQVISWAGTSRGRSVDIIEARTVDAVAGQLNVDDFDVFLVHDLDQADPGEPAAAGASWESGRVLSSFSRAGGVIVVIDGADGTGEMHELMNAGHLLDLAGALKIDGQSDITDEQVWNNAPFDVLGGNVISPFLGTSHTCVFDTSVEQSNEIIFVLGDDDAKRKGADPRPVAIHRVIAP